MPTNRLTALPGDELVSVSPIYSPILTGTPDSLAVESPMPIGNQSTSPATPCLPTPPCSPTSDQYASRNSPNVAAVGLGIADFEDDDDVTVSSSLTQREEDHTPEDLYTPISTPFASSASSSCLSDATEQNSFTPSYPPSETQDGDIELRHRQVTNRKSERNIFIAKRDTDESLEALEVSDEDIDTPINLDTLSSEEELHLHYENVTLSNVTKLLQESKRFRKGDVLCGKHAKIHATTSNKKLQLINLDFVPKPPTQPPSGPVSRRHHNRASRQDTESPRRPFLPKIKRQLGVNRIDANQSNWLEILPPSPESPQFTLPSITGVNVPRPPTQPRPPNSNSHSRRESSRRKFGRKIGPGKNIWTGDRHDI